MTRYHHYYDATSRQITLTTRSHTGSLTKAITTTIVGNAECCFVFYSHLRIVLFVKRHTACVACKLVITIVGLTILTYNDRDVTHLHIKWGVAVGSTVIGAGTRHLPPSWIHAPVTNQR